MITISKTIVIDLDLLEIIISNYYVNSEQFKMQTCNKNESGMAHLGLVLLAVVVLGVVGAGYWRVTSTDKTQNNLAAIPTADQTETLPENLENLKTIDEVQQIAGAENGTSIIKFVLETKDGSYVYRVVLSNGKKLIIDASTGRILSEETTDISDDDKIPAGVQVTVTPAEAYKIAAQKSSSPIKSIEMEVEDKKVTYKIEYRDGSKIEIDATGGDVIKSEIKDHSEDKEDTEDHEDEDKQEDDKQEDEEDHSNEDSDDSVDSEDHAEEDR